MKKEKKLTQEDINLLFSENWLTIKQQHTFSIYEGIVKTFKEIEAICPDQTILNFIFEEFEVEVTNISFNVVNYHYGEQTHSQSFNDINDAIIEREKLIKSSHPLNVRIEISYDLKMMQ